jgi:hypothetical protein
MMNHRRGEGRWCGGGEENEERWRERDREHRVRRNEVKRQSKKVSELPTRTEGKDETYEREGSDGGVSRVRTERTEVIIVDRRERKDGTTEMGGNNRPH